MSNHSEDDAKLVDIICAWDLLEKSSGSPPIIDFCLIDPPAVEKAKCRLAVLMDMIKMLEECEDEVLSTRVNSYIAYLRAQMGQEIEFTRYVEDTQGFTPRVFSDQEIDRARAAAANALDVVGLRIGSSVESELADADARIPINDIESFFREGLAREGSLLEQVLQRPVSFQLKIEFCDVPEYWGYWVDGDTESFRLRFNSRTKPYAEAEALQFLHHELLAHCGQMHIWQQSIELGTIRRPWGLTFVAGPEQLCFEGLAQTLPVWLYRDELPPLVRARIQLGRYTMLIRNNIHWMINSGKSIEECVAFSRKYLQYIEPDRAAGDLRSRTRNPLLRSYQFVYPQSFHTFLDLSERLDAATASAFLKRCFTEVVNPVDILAYE